METNQTPNQRQTARPLVILAAALFLLLGLIFASSPASAQIGDLKVCTQDCGPDPEPTVPPALPPIIVVPAAPTPVPTLPPVLVPPPTPVPVPTLPPVLIDPPAPEPNLSAVIFHSCHAGGVVVAYSNSGGGAGGFGITVAHEGQVPFIADLFVPANTEATFLVELDEGATVTVSALDQGATITADCEPDEVDQPAPETPDAEAPGTDVPQAEEDEAEEDDAAGPAIDVFDAKEDGQGDPVIMGDESAAPQIQTTGANDPIVLTLVGLAGALLMAIVVLLIVLLSRRRDPAA